ncbi:MAG: tetratricopeptide repeat protein [Gammaproteobacteria bacterium]|nr:tetratricopeptide repeat protein [Gammaproteobacteria bacterium]
MSEYLSDKEQWEQIRTWIRENALSVLVAVALVVAGFQGWRWWQGRQDARGIAASAAYTRMIEALEKGDRTQAFTRLGELERAFPGSPYADQGKMLAARVYVEGNELDKAVHELETVATGSRDHELALVARLRLARVEIAQGKPDAALATLNAVEPGAFAPRYAEVRGDIFYAKGDKAAALEEYRSALGGAEGDTALLNLKIADLSADAPAAAPGAAHTTAAPAPAATVTVTK